MTMKSQESSQSVNDNNSPNDGADKDVVIAVMGITGAGKSYFIRQITGNDEVTVGVSQVSCTQEIRTFQKTIDGINYTLVDTPGFNDTKYSERTDTDTLIELSKWLEVNYRSGFKLSGIVYLHPIIHNRMEGSSLRSLRMFRKLCGDDNLHNVFLVTTHWDEVKPEKGNYREAELQDEEDFWKPLIKNGARVARYLGEYESGISILRSLSTAQRMTLEIQRETVIDNLEISDTAAGKVLNGEILAVKSRYEKEIQQVRDELAEIKESKDAESVKARVELSKELNNLEHRLAKTEREKAKLNNDRREESRQLELRLAEAIRSMENSKKERNEEVAGLEEKFKVLELESKKKQQSNVDWEDVGAKGLKTFLVALEFVMKAYGREENGSEKTGSKGTGSKENGGKENGGEDIRSKNIRSKNTEVKKTESKKAEVKTPEVKTPNKNTESQNTRSEDRKSNDAGRGLAEPSFTVTRPRLQSTLQIPWERSMRLGLGFDATVFQLAGSAFEPFDVSSDGTHPKVSSNFTIITNHQEMQRHIDASLDASITTFGVGIKAAYKHMNSIHFSNTSMTTVLRCTIEYPPAFYSIKPTLTPAAAKLLESSSKRFHEAYGSHFIAGQANKSSLYTTTTFNASSVEKLNEFSTSVTGSKGGGAISANAHFLEKAASSNVRIECSCVTEGFLPGQLSEQPSPADVQKLIKAHQEQRPKHEVALLEHYSMINADISIRDGGFEGPNEIRAAVKNVLRVKLKYADCSMREAQKIIEQVIDIGHELVALEPSQSSWKASLEEQKDLLKRLCNSLDLCREREYILEQAKKHKTMDHSTAMKADCNRNYDYAATNIEDLPSTIRNEVKYNGPNNFRVHGKGAQILRGRRRIEAGSCILKFRVENCWVSDTNGRFKITSGGVGHDHVEVEFEAQQWRGADWNLHAWYVEGLTYAQT